MRTRLAILAGVAVLAVGPALADTKNGVEAWERGDYRTAVDQWRAGAERGDADAQFNLGQAYKLGRGVPIDTQRAEEYYRKAAAQGHVQAEDNYGLALFQNGKAREAIPYLEKSVARGEPRAQYILGTMLFNGTDIKKDWVRAYALTSRAAEGGLPQATQSLQQMDSYLTPNQRQQGLALARSMASGAGSAPPAQVASAGTGTSAIRPVDVPPSYAPTRQRPDLPPTPPSYGQPPVYAAAEQPPAPYYASTPAPQPVRRAAPAKTAGQPTPLPAPRVSGGWRLQLGAFGDAANARKLWSSVAGRFPGRSVDYVKAGALTRVMVGGFPSRAAAQAACGAVSPCVPVAP